MTTTATPKLWSLMSFSLFAWKSSHTSLQTFHWMKYVQLVQFSPSSVNGTNVITRIALVYFWILLNNNLTKKSVQVDMLHSSSNQTDTNTCHSNNIHFPFNRSCYIHLEHSIFRCRSCGSQYHIGNRSFLRNIHQYSSHKVRRNE